ncbi:MAG: T9SS type A sorting domain-containing protein, partial [Flavobacteriales bacterium]|nr:T9SS type A sorting domain-containing protein [Flavobacteriales bacterium]
DLPDSSPADVRIFDVSGRLVQQERITSGDRIGTNNLPDGMYIVQFQLSGSEVFSKKLVVRH